ncbi:hypothetical protein FOA43_002474 [Brettanomyces nanus]|uniref:GPI ethanolamine phosphate transferase 2 n=1 Tax=Eeniella nana TaxID=13502 RepID=A0A875S025_EENNA|nr:uncharacterized protein FOA43_002474 [Brettanomyces nanus]QPG75131.1 hypothetical protein FOA43_002474 [Brettanomyces nanus]
MKLLGILVVVVTQLVAYLIFCKGFFPTKVLLTPEELTKYTTAPPPGYKEPKRQFNKVIVMLVDAMRADFVFSDQSNMNFTQYLLNEGYALGFTAFSNPPTVTLPRLKGITTGSVPNFIDAVLNIAEDDTSSSLGDQDSWIKQMYLSNWKIDMFGDDTWLKLFPDYFSKSDGTSSFYVSDYTIVDQNVTRHLPEELSSDGLLQWDGMILHYLGMDHIGHKGGSQSANMPAKQRELDTVVKKIFDSLISKDNNTLMVLLGDHGMNDAGNHGGSSIGEVSPAMVLISGKFKHEGLKNSLPVPLPVDPEFGYLAKVDQIDLVPTLTELCGLTVPINNLGTFISSLLPLYATEDEKRSALIKNALQLKVLLDKAHGKSIKPLQDICNVNSEQALLDFIKSAKQELSEASSDYNYFDLHLGMLIYLAVSLVVLALFLVHYRNHLLLAVANLAFFIVYGLSFIGSSLIEEEHHIWWFFTSIFVLYTIELSARNKSFSFFFTLLLLASLRLIKGWNNSGQKYNSVQFLKISKYISCLPVNQGPNVFAAVLMATFLMFFVVKVKDQFGLEQNLPRFLEFFSLSVMTFVLFSLKMVSYLTSTFDLDTGNSGLQRWWLYFIDWLKSYGHFNDLDSVSYQLYRLFQYVWALSAIAIFSIPLACRSVGIVNSDNYNLILSGILTFVANWAPSIFWSVSYTVTVLDSLPKEKLQQYKWNCLYDRMVFNLAFYSVAGLLLIASCYNLRFHLFIWTVFCPKLLYYLAWLGSNLLIDFGLSSLIIAMDV